MTWHEKYHENVGICDCTLYGYTDSCTYDIAYAITPPSFRKKNVGQYFDRFTKFNLISVLFMSDILGGLYKKDYDS